MSTKEIKKRHFKKIYDNAILINCECGCGIKIKNKDKYGRNKHFINGHNNRKYKNPTQYKREWNHRNRKQRQEYKMKRLRNIKSKLILKAGGECSKCKTKYNKTNASIFDFHHIKNKLFNLNLGEMNNKNKKQINKEFKKCILLCSNCHRRKHSKDY